MARWNSLFKGQFTGSSSAAAVAASASSAAAMAATPFAYRAFLGVDGQAAWCDAGPTGVRTASLNTKEYSIQLKPLFSAFEMQPLAWTALNSFSFYYSGVLQHILQDAERRDDEDDEDDEHDERRHVDLVLPFWNSVYEILRQTTVVTTRRVLERFVVHHCSQRTAWKLLKDLPESALRKSKRGMPFYTYTFCVARTTFKGNFLGVASSCLVLVGTECYRFIRDIVNSENEGENVVHQRGRGRVFVKRVCGGTVKCVATLVFASIGAGIGAAIFCPTSGQSNGYMLGEFVGPSIATYFINRVPYLKAA